MLKNISLIFIIILFFVVLLKFMKVNLKELANKLVEGSFGYLGNINTLFHENNKKKEKLTKGKVFARTKLYRICEGIIKDLGYKDVTVEGFLTGAVIISGLLNILIYYSTRSIFMVIVGLPSLVIFIITALFMISSDVYYVRRYAMMDAEDLIITGLAEGVYPAIRGNIGLFSPVVKGMYQSFLDRIVMGKSVEESLEILGEDLGPESFDFIRQLIQYESTGRSGMIDIFWDTMKSNTHIREDMLEMQMFLRELNKSFMACLIITLVLFILFIGSNVKLLTNLFQTPLGNIAVFVNLCIIIYGFARIQSLRN